MNGSKSKAEIKILLMALFIKQKILDYH